jgi:hypothetical protein
MSNTISVYSSTAVTSPDIVSVCICALQTTEPRSAPLPPTETVGLLDHRLLAELPRPCASRRPGDRYPTHFNSTLSSRDCSAKNSWTPHYRQSQTVQSYAALRQQAPRPASQAAGLGPSLPAPAVAASTFRLSCDESDRGLVVGRGK